MPHSNGSDYEVDGSASTPGSRDASSVESPRPNKRRRLQNGGASRRKSGDTLSTESCYASDDGVWGQSEDCFDVGRSAKQRKSLQRADIDEEYYLPDELGHTGERRQKTLNQHKIHVPRDQGFFEKMVFTQTQVDLDSSPSHFRGPVWKRPAQAVAAPISSNSNSTAKQVPNENRNPRSVLHKRQTTLTGFKDTTTDLAFAARTDNIQSDEELAKRLQAEENLHSRENDNGHILPRPPHEISTHELPDELADLPSDAFCSSTPETSPVKDVQIVSSGPAQDRPLSNMSGRQLQELRQTTILGRFALQEEAPSQAKTRTHAWPLKARDEPLTHHILDTDAMKTWIYPINLGAIRDYQFNIVSRSLFHNTLVALPTGLGKTFIAATVMLNYYRWTKDAQMIFMAPTKPLIAQQMEACLNIVGISRKSTVLMTGETAPALRAEEWLEKRVFFMTPQTVINDLKTGICDPKKIVLVVVDEAHKASGGYAYTEVISFLRRFNTSCRVQALTATPGSTVEAVQGVIDSLGIARVELRTEQSLDIRKYTHEKHTETEIFEWSDEQELVMEKITKVLQPSVDKLRQQNAYWSRDPMQLNAFALTQARKKWMASDAGRKASLPLKGMVNSLFATLSSLAHSIGLLKFHGIGPFYSGMLSFQREVDSGQKKSKTMTEIANSEHFVGMMRLLRGWTNNPDFIGHPKLQYLREVVLNHFLDAGNNSPTRIMVFASYRDSTEEICRVLKRNEPMIRPHVFVGQAASKGSEGMDQKRQNAVIQDFKSGKYNVLVATSIGEEGLDIGDVDLIVCYDASSSPIRMLQRIGRTGRKRVGRVVLLLMKGKEENDYAKAQDSYTWIQKSIADPNKYTYHESQSPRILPSDAHPVVDKRFIEIPVENSQPIDLNEKNRKPRGKPLKRPPKKFHMPDGVRTGFVKASKMHSDDSDTEQPAPKRKTSVRKIVTDTKVVGRAPQPEPEPVQLPFLDDVLLNSMQQRELERKYARTASEDTSTEIRAPDPTQHPETLREPGPYKFVKRGRYTKMVAKAMRAMHAVNDETVERMRRLAERNEYLHDNDNLERLARPAHPVDDVWDHPPGEFSEEQFENGNSRHSRQTLHVPTGNDRHAARSEPAGRTRAAHGRPRNAQNQRLRRCGTFEAEEGEESSPERTQADMRIGTQGIDLGSHDTSGEDEAEEHDSELDDFVVASDRTIEPLTSSQRLLHDSSQVPILGPKNGRLRKPDVVSNNRLEIPSSPPPVNRRESGTGCIDESSPVVDPAREIGNSDVEDFSISSSPNRGNGAKRRVIDSSDSDE